MRRHRPLSAGISIAGGWRGADQVQKLGGGVRLAIARTAARGLRAVRLRLDEATRKQLERGRMVTELMKQPQYKPLQVWEMAVTLFAVNNGYFDDIEVKKALAAESALRSFLKSKHGDLVDRIEQTKDLGKDDEAKLHEAIKDFKKNATY